MSQAVSTDIPMDTHPNVFQRWKSARTTLTHAIDGYLTASVELCDALSSSACHPSSRHSLEQTLSGIDLELSSLQSEEEKLKRTRAALANERNRSRTLTSVHRLPSEILATIFSISSSRYTRSDRTARIRGVYLSPATLASVCSSWRQLALQCPSLWSYIDIIVGDGLSLHHPMQLNLWVERSQNVPLYVNIRDHNYRDDDLPYTTTWQHVKKLVKFLAPLMHRVYALDINATLGEIDMFSSVMKSWIKNGSTSVEKTLQVFNNLKLFSEDPSGLWFGPESNAERFNTFFRTINRLLLRYCRISRDIQFHEGLVELHLEGVISHHYPSQQEFVEMLAACPRLRILALVNYWVEPSEEETPGQVTLNHLQSLSLETDDPGYSLAPIFPLLLIGPKALAMSLTPEKDTQFIAEAKAFFGRTNVTKLCVRDRVRQSSSTALLSFPIPHLETLAIENFDIFGQAFEDFFGPNGEGEGTALWPRLHTLYLKDLSIDASCLRKLVLLHPSIKKLHIYRPRPVGKRDALMTDEECNHLDNSVDIVEDYFVDFRSGNGPIDTWDFVILEDL
ncbi:hypothetical protein FRC08_018943 [Ceratobasidium sp. 394]|nr:hypothetical protein FRC08_018943 [Ceratobasidium sp. 394]